jgi:hypothetical protein
MKSFDCGRFVKWGLIAGLIGWGVFIATLIYAAYFIPDTPLQAGNLFSQRRGVQAGGFMAGAWLAIAGLALCVTGYFKEYKGLKCLLGVIPAALYVGNVWSWLVFAKFAGN